MIKFKQVLLNKIEIDYIESLSPEEKKQNLYEFINLLDNNADIVQRMDASGDLLDDWVLFDRINKIAYRAINLDTQNNIHIFKLDFDQIDQFVSKNTVVKH